MSAAERIRERLGLVLLPREGGFFAETYRADEVLAAEVLPARYAGTRALSTAIYYLLTPETFSSLHRLQSDELFHFYQGDPVEMLQLLPDGGVRVHLLGADVLAGMEPQVLVPRGVWQGARLRTGGEFALLGSTVAPGFDYADYEHGDRPALCGAYPEARGLIEALTRG